MGGTMTTSYEELTQESKEQVDAFMGNAMVGDLYSIADFHVDWLREHVSNLVQTVTKKKDNKATILTSREWKSLSRAYLNLYNLLSGMPSYMGDYFTGREHEFKDVERWEERLSEPINKRSKR